MHSDRPPRGGNRGAGPDPEVLLLTLPITVRFSDCDPLGHVNNAKYSTYLEQARIVLWRKQIGFWSRRAAEGGPRGEGFILARTEIDFKSQAHDGDELLVKLWISGFGRSSATYRYEVVDAPSGRLVAAAKTVQVWFDYDANETRPISDELKTKLTSALDSALDPPR